MPVPPSTLAIFAPPDAIVSVPPVATRTQLLPFEALAWENFERLCHRMTALDGDVEYCARYGSQGEAQEGIDIYARLSDDRYHCLQAKRHKSFGAAKLRDAVDLFLAGSWVGRAERFTLAVQASLRSTAVQNEIERQTKRLGALGIRFEASDGDQLTDRLRDQPRLIDDFFGRAWVAALLGAEVAATLEVRLDGEAFARVRAQLARVYEAQFHFVDPGSFGSIGDEDSRPGLTLLERFEIPDMLVRERNRPVELADIAGAQKGQDAGAGTNGTAIALPESTRASGAAANSRVRRVPLGEWLGEEDRLVALGDAGCGKSTLLRVAALDILYGQNRIPEIAMRWGQLLPVYVPFARWASQAARDGHAIGIKEIVRRSLEPLMTASIVDLIDRAIDERRVLLLIDGLDEWSSEQSARATLSALVTTVEAHGIPAILSGRPRGLARIGAIPASWKRGTVAPLAIEQQAAIAGRWFRRYSAAVPDPGPVSDAQLRTGRFMAELARDASLSAFATVPLLLVGLVTLALRGQILPRTKAEIYDQLVRVLLEIHPDSRATASGDTEPRFRHARDPDQRRAAIARLAFAVREEAGGAGMSTVRAREILREFLASSEGFELGEAQAAAAAAEILAVNAETQGLIVEKAQGEVGFVHAGFEEFLGAEHIGGWPFARIEAFVQGHAGDGRWRNVLANLVARIARRDEIDRLVAIIDARDCDELALFHRQALLGDIAFGTVARAPVTARRLATGTIQRVEADDWMPARREALASALKGLADPALRPDVEARISRWLPARHSRRAPLIQAFRLWSPNDALAHTLWQAMHDEDRGVQRTAAAAYADRFASDEAAYHRLIDGLARTRDIHAAAAMLECLALGWPGAPDSGPLFEAAWASQAIDLRLTGILGLAERGTATDAMRDAVLHATNFWSAASYPHRELAAALLLKYWPGDDALVAGALEAQSNRHNSPWEYDVATAYLMESPVERDDVRAWILRQLEGEFPFNVLGRDNRIWSQVGRFAEADPAIRTAANTHWLEPRNRLISMYKLPNYVAYAADPDVGEMLVGMLGETNNMDRYWAVTALLSGWGREHPLVGPAFDKLAQADDADLLDLVSLLPEILPDKKEARDRLIHMASQPEIRRDLLAVGLEACGCDGTDDAAIAALLDRGGPQAPLYDPAYPLFRAFGTHPKVRALALQRVGETDGPAAAIAEAYADDPELAPALFGMVVPLPVELRTQIVEAASAGATDTALEAVLARAMAESDPELRARMVIARGRALPTQERDAFRDTLLDAATTVGADYESARAAALAGLAAIGALDSLAALKERGEPVGLETGGMMAGIAAVERLVCEKFASFEAAFGDGLAARLNSRGRKDRYAYVLSEAPSASSAARGAFLALAERGEMPRTVKALRALAGERPRSALLLERCWEVFDCNDRGNDQVVIRAEVATILKEHFPELSEVRGVLAERFKAVPFVAGAVPLAIFAPDDEALPYPFEVSQYGHEFGDWALAVILAARRADGPEFCTVVEGMTARQWRSQFDAQSFANRAIDERLRSDQSLEVLFAERINSGTDPSIAGSFARYLAAAGKLGLDARSRSLALLAELGAAQQIPIAGYDAIAEQWRATRATLLDAITAGLELA